jgi:rSAM/selenodomain-associated transferase 1
VAPADVVVVLTRAPSAGGKTRLFAALGRPSDPALLEALLLDTIEGASAAGARLIVAVHPPAAAAEVRALTRLETIGQADGDIGVRMHDAMARTFAAGARRVALIGSDLPEIGGAHVAAAYAALDGEPRAIVLGPALDGGYYLIAATRVPPVFDGIRWSSAHVLADTREAAARAGLPVRLLEPLGDVDTVDDLQRLSAAGSRSLAWARANGIVSSRGSATSDGSA